jgi:protease II
VFIASPDRLGSPNSEDVLVYEERDSGFFVNIGRDSSDQILYIRTGVLQTALLISRPTLSTGFDLQLWYMFEVHPTAQGGGEADFTS